MRQGITEGLLWFLDLLKSTTGPNNLWPWTSTSSYQWCCWVKPSDKRGNNLVGGCTGLARCKLDRHQHKSTTTLGPDSTLFTCPLRSNDIWTHASSTRSSQAVTHCISVCALCYCTSVFEWVLQYATWLGSWLLLEEWRLVKRAQPVWSKAFID